MYCLNGHEPHWFHADDEDVHCICTFSPPCDGGEVHNADGIFPFIGEDGQADYSYWSKKVANGEKITVELKDMYMLEEEDKNKT